VKSYNNESLALYMEEEGHYLVNKINLLAKARGKAYFIAGTMQCLWDSGIKYYAHSFKEI